MPSSNPWLEFGPAPSKLQFANLFTPPLSRSTVERMHKRGEVRFIRLGRQRVAVDLLDWLDRNEIKVSA